MQNRRGLILIFLIGGLAGWGVGHYSSALPVKLGLQKPTKQVDLSSLPGLSDLLQRKFDGSIDASKLLDGAKAGLVAATGDPYTTYLDAKSAKELKDDLNGTLSGIGAEIGIKNSILTVISPVAGSPADKAGLRAKDQIITINGEDTSGMALDEAVHKIRGPENTQVKLKVIRGNGAPFDVTITRQVITVPSVKWSMKPGNVGYIQITQFGEDTSAKMDQAATELSGQGAKKIILDLRNNPGGYLTAAVDVSSQFLPQGQLVVEERRGNTSIDKLNSHDGGKLIGLPTVVLVNGGSASASEITAGALQDHHVAQLIGEKTFGKGSVQEVEPLAGGAELKVTIAHWFTPGGKNINKEGIAPGKEVKLEQADYDAGRDPQLDAAMAALK